jgi:hypothetical protein
MVAALIRRRRNGRHMYGDTQFLLCRHPAVLAAVSAMRHSCMADISRSFDAVVTVGPKGRVVVPLPFAPDDVWGTKPDHHVAGTIGAHRIRVANEKERPR